jgi:predicted nucleic acid-binding protein
MVDTNVASYLMKLRHSLYKPDTDNHKIATWYAQTLTGSQLAISFATKAELERGLITIADPARKARLRVMVDGFYSLVYVCNSNELVSDTWGRLCGVGAAQKKINNAMIKESQLNDLWIAATAIAYDLPLVGHDSDFLWMQDQGLTLIRYPS